MTVMPADAPRSEDGQWWWDGTQWQPVTQDAGAGAPAAGAGATPGSATQTSSDAVGQLSDDGQWRWDGTQWQPAAAAGQNSPLTLSFTQMRADAVAARDGTPAIHVTYTITNAGSTPIEAGRLLAGKFVVSEDGSAEQDASIVGAIDEALAPGEEHSGNVFIQADPGSWNVSIQMTDTTTGEVVLQSEGVSVHVAGTVASKTAFDDSQSYTLTVTITQVEHVEGSLFRVHYDLQSDRDVPAGLPVSGEILGSAGTRTAQTYDLTTGLSAGQARAHYLTLESHVPDHITATITVDPGGTSETSASVEVDIAEDATPTITG